MTLGQARRLFSKSLVTLLLHVPTLGLDFAFDEVTDHITAKDPTTDHMPGSLHEIGLAADILLYRDGVYLTNPDEYKLLGELWEAMGKTLKLPLAWGGRFNDANHFSFEWQGRKL